MNVKELLLTSDGVYKKFILLALTLGHVANLRGKEEDLSGEGPHQGGERALTASAWALIISPDVHRTKARAMAGDDQSP